MENCESKILSYGRNLNLNSSLKSMATIHRRVSWRNFIERTALGLPITEEDYLAYLEAIVQHLNPDDEIAPRLLERFRKAKVDGIPFKEVKTDDIVPPKEEEEDE